MLHKQRYLTLLSGLFIFTITNTSQGPQNPTSEGERQLYKAAGQVIASQANSAIDLIKEKFDFTTPVLTKAQVNLYKKQSESADKEMTLKDKQALLNDQQALLNDKQTTLIDKQADFTDKQIEENNLDRHLKRIAVIRETMALLNPNDPDI